MAWYRDHYFGRSNYVHIGGKPLVACFGPIHFKTPEEWARVLAAFVKRNDGRRTRLEVNDPSIGVQIQETGYSLMGATYDHRDGRLELMLGVPRAAAPHLTRTITGVDFLSTLADATGRELGLCIKHGEGQTVLLLAPET